MSLNSSSVSLSRRTDWRRAPGCRREGQQRAPASAAARGGTAARSHRPPLTIFAAERAMKTAFRRLGLSRTSAATSRVRRLAVRHRPRNHCPASARGWTPARALASRGAALRALAGGLAAAAFDRALAHRLGRLGLRLRLGLAARVPVLASVAPAVAAAAFGLSAGGARLGPSASSAGSVSAIGGSSASGRSTIGELSGSTSLGSFRPGALRPRRRRGAAFARRGLVGDRLALRPARSAAAASFFRLAARARGRHSPPRGAPRPRPPRRRRRRLRRGPLALARARVAASLGLVLGLRRPRPLRRLRSLPLRPPRHPSSTATAGVRAAGGATGRGPELSTVIRAPSKLSSISDLDRHAIALLDLGQFGALLVEQ